VLNVFNLLQWCFNRLIPAQPSQFGMFVNPRMATLTRGSFHSNNILFETNVLQRCYGASRRSFRLPSQLAYSAFHWQIYDNECKTSGGTYYPVDSSYGSSRPTSNQCRGLLLVRPDTPGAFSQCCLPTGQVRRAKTSRPLRRVGSLGQSRPIHAFRERQRGSGHLHQPRRTSSQNGMRSSALPRASLAASAA